MIHPSRVVSVGVERPLETVARFLAEPRNFPRWASGLAGGLSPEHELGEAGGEPGRWVVDSPQGRVTLRFSPPNAFGVADHWVHLPDATVVYVPLRAVANGDGTEVSLTLFRLPGMDAARFDADADWVRRDLAALKRVLEDEGGS
jgi:hypothetical protein